MSFSHLCTTPPPSPNLTAAFRAMEAILVRLLEPDNEVIKAATEDLRAAFKQPGVIPELCAVLGNSQQVQIRQYAAVLLR